jgi:hypothetical protein
MLFYWITVISYIRGSDIIRTADWGIPTHSRYAFRRIVEGWSTGISGLPSAGNKSHRDATSILELTFVDLSGRLCGMARALVPQLMNPTHNYDP